MNNTVLVGMSGGVDSSAAACLLLEQGYDVIGVSLELWQDEGRYAIEGKSGLEDARQVAGCLKIPYYILNCKEEFQKHVIDYFVNEYIQGRTPNPCVICNRFVKWELLTSMAKQFGAGYIATGHYASIRKHCDTGRLCVCTSTSQNKDQSYMLYALTQAQVAATLLPAGDYSKEEIRAIAERYKLPVANKPDSQDICFIPDGDWAGFIAGHTNTVSEGNIIDEAGNVLGRHKGIFNYTVGQRKGLGIALGKPMYVKSISAVNNTVTLSEDISVSEMTVKDVNWMAYDHFQGERRLNVKIRYSHKAVSCLAHVEGGAGSIKIRCLFDAPQRAVTPGQAAVFYDGYCIAFGGVIE